MIDIENYDEIEAKTGEFNSLPAGGYICVIKAVEATKSQNGNDMLVMNLDIAEGEYKNFFENKYQERLNNPQDMSVKWPNGGIYRQLFNTEVSNPYFKGLITTLEASNPNFKWDKDETKLKGLLLGGIFGREEYEPNKFSTKIFYVRTVKKIRENNFAIPEDKMLEKDESSVITDDDLPF